MLKRTVVALVWIPILLIIILVLPKFITALIAGVFCAISAYELLGQTKLVRSARMLIYTMVAAFFVSIWSYFGCPTVAGVLGMVIFFSLLFSEIMLSDMKIPFSRLAMCMVGGLVVPYMFNALIRILVMSEGRAYIIIPFVVAFMNDVGAYFVGSFFGKHKLCPSISPKKTVEGMGGGIVAAILGLIIYSLVLQLAFGYTINYLLLILYAVVGGLAGVYGDLCFSVIKRQTGIKDYGNIFPGHGGVLDRFDSVVVVTPLIEVLLYLIPMAYL